MQLVRVDMKPRIFLFRFTRKRVCEEFPNFFLPCAVRGKLYASRTSHKRANPIRKSVLMAAKGDGRRE